MPRLEDSSCWFVGCSGSLRVRRAYLLQAEGIPLYLVETLGFANHA